MTSGLKQRDSRVIEAKTYYYPVIHQDGSFSQAEMVSVLAWGFAGDRDLAAYQAIFTDEGALGKHTKEVLTLANGQKMRAEEAAKLWPDHAELINEKWRR